VTGVRSGRAGVTARAPWDSTISTDVFVLDSLMVSAQRGGAWDLWMMNGGQLTRPITRDSAVEADVAFSPDLTRIAYIAAPGPRSALFQLWVANPDGSEARALTADSVPVGRPSFVGPAGDRIVFQSGRPGQQQLYIIGVDGSGRRALTTGAGDNSLPSVHPDGTKLVYSSVRESAPGQRARAEIYEMNLDGTGERQLTTNPRTDDSPQYNADGHVVYFLRDEGGSPPAKRVYRMDAATREESPLTPPGVFVRAFSLSPDGTKLALTIFGSDNAVRVAIFDAVTQTLTNVPVGPGEALSGPVFRPAAPRPSN
jgi:TolB protein